MRERILDLLKEKKGNGILQSDISKRLNLSKSTVSEHLTELERKNSIFRKRVAGKSNRVWLIDEVPHPVEGLIRMGILRAAEYPHVTVASENLDTGTRINVFESAINVTDALAKGKIDVAFSPLITQILYSLTNDSFRIYGGCAHGGHGIVSRASDPKSTPFGTSQLSTMEVNLKSFLREKELDPQEIEIRYFNSPKKMFEDCLRGEIKTAAIWEPYLTLLENALEDPKTWGPSPTAEGLPCCTMAVNESWLKKNEQIFMDFAREYVRATKSIQEGKRLKKASNLLSEKIKIDKDLLRVSFKRYEFDWILDKEKIENYIKEFNLKNVPGDLTKTFRTNYIKKAL